MVERLVSVVNRLDQIERKALGLTIDDVMQKFRVMIEDDIFLELLDTEKVFPLVWGYPRMECPTLYFASGSFTTRKIGDVRQ